MKLTPSDPPGRATRKARAFAADISELRAQGYSLDAIRHALAGAGVQVSLSTVRREALRVGRQGSTATAVDPPAPSLLNPPIDRDSAGRIPLAGASSASSPTHQPSGMETADAFIAQCVTNPLIRARMRDPPMVRAASFPTKPDHEESP